jgi:hypothetical protein
MDTLLQESTFGDQRFEDLWRNFILADRFTGLAEFGVRSIDNADIRLKGLAGPPSPPRQNLGRRGGPWDLNKVAVPLASHDPVDSAFPQTQLDE